MPTSSLSAGGTPHRRLKHRPVDLSSRGGRAIACRTPTSRDRGGAVSRGGNGIRISADVSAFRCGRKSKAAKPRSSFATFYRVTKDWQNPPAAILTRHRDMNDVFRFSRSAGSNRELWDLLR